MENVTTRNNGLINNSAVATASALVAAVDVTKKVATTNISIGLDEFAKEVNYRPAVR